MPSIPLRLARFFLLFSTGAAVCTLGCGPGGQKAVLQGHTAPVIAAAFSPDGKTLATLGEDSTLRLWNATSGAEQKSIALVATRIAYSPDGRWLAATTREGIKLFDAASGNEYATLKLATIDPMTGVEQSRGAPVSLAFSAQGNLLAAGSENPSGSPSGIGIWNLGGDLKQPPRMISGSAFCLAFSPDGKLLAAGTTGARSREGGSSGGLSLFEVETGNKVANFDGHKAVAHPDGQTACVAFSPDGTLLASGSADTLALVEGTPGLNAQRGEIKLWDVASGKELAKLDPQLKQVLSLAFKPDGKTLFAAGGNPFPTMQEGAVRKFNVPSGASAGKLVQTKHHIRCFALAPSGRLAAWASSEIAGPSAGAIVKRAQGEKVEPRAPKSTLQLWNVN